jgi:hypothetical protein
VSAQLDYGQIGTAISLLYGEETVLVRPEVDTAAGRLLEALLDLHANTAIDLAHFPEVDAFARLIAPTDFSCCTKPSVEDVALKVIAEHFPGAIQMCPCGCGSTAADAARLDTHMGYL